LGKSSAPRPQSLFPWKAARQGHSRIVPCFLLLKKQQAKATHTLLKQKKRKRKKKKKEKAAGQGYSHVSLKRKKAARQGLSRCFFF
jgi:hypothetical protein